MTNEDNTLYHFSDEEDGEDAILAQALSVGSRLEAARPVILYFTLKCNLLGDDVAGAMSWSGCNSMRNCVNWGIPSWGQHWAHLRGSLAWCNRKWTPTRAATCLSFCQFLTGSPTPTKRRISKRGCPVQQRQAQELHRQVVVTEGPCALEEHVHLARTLPATARGGGSPYDGRQSAFVQEQTPQIHGLTVFITHAAGTFSVQVQFDGAKEGVLPSPF